MNEHGGRDIRSWIMAFRASGYDAMRTREMLYSGEIYPTDPYVDNDVAFIEQWPVAVVCDDDGDYPAKLDEELGRRRPGMFFCLGNTGLLSRPSILIVGARDASEKGCWAAHGCAHAAARKGMLVASGYARGIDQAAHMGALEGGGETVAVLPYGLSRFSVRRTLGGILDEERFLAVSEMPPSAGFLVKSALRRNRLLVALADVVIIIEPGESGGTWYTAECARKAGKPLYFHTGSRPEYTGRLEEMGGIEIEMTDGEPDISQICQCTGM